MRLIVSRRIAGLLLVLVTLPIALVLRAPSASAASHSVTISNYQFGPSTMTIAAGDTVTWTNQDTAPHDVTTTSAPTAIHGSTMTKGQSWSYTFTVPGTYSYICSIHPDMKATLVVKPAAAPATHAPVQHPGSGLQTHVTRQPVTTRRVVVPAATAAAGPTTAVQQPATAATAASAQTGTTVAPVQQQVAAAPAAATSTDRPLRPLLLVAGVVAAVAVLCLLLLAARREDT